MDRSQNVAQARFAIEGIVFRYAEALDSGDLEALAELFAAGVVKSAVGEPAKGAQEVFDLYAKVVKFYDADENPVPYQRRQCTPRTRHVTTNLIFEFDNAVTQAEVRSVFTVYQNLGGRNELVAGGRYVDQFKRTMAGWHLAERQILLDSPGDLSRHLHQ